MKNTASIQENNAMETWPRGMYGSTVNAVDRGYIGRAGKAKAKAQTRIYPGEAGVVSGRRIRLEMSSIGKFFTLRGFLLALASVLAIGTAVVLMLFNFESARIYGNTKYSKEQIESFITRGTLGENTFVMAVKYHNRKVTDIPFVDRIDISIVNLSTVQVNITEKPTDACVFYKGKNVYISKEGMVETVSGRTVEETTVINGVVLTHSKTETQALAKNQLGLDLSLELLRAAHKYGIRPDSIDVDEKSNLTAVFGDVKVLLGKTGYEQKMFKLHQIYSYLEGRRGTISMIGYKDTYDPDANIVLCPYISEDAVQAALQRSEAAPAEEAPAETEAAAAEKAAQEEAQKAAEEAAAAEAAEENAAAPADPAAPAADPAADPAAANPAAPADPAAQDAQTPASDTAAEPAATPAADPAAAPQAETQAQPDASQPAAEQPADSQTQTQPETAAPAAQTPAADPAQAVQTAQVQTDAAQQAAAAPAGTEADAAQPQAEAVSQ